MTGFTLPPVAVDYDARWVSVDLHGDLGEWARRTAREFVERFGDRRDPDLEQRVATVLQQVAPLARQAQDASIALLLYPGPGQGVKAIARFCPVDLAGQQGDAAWESLIGMVSADLPGQEQAEVVELTSPAGPYRRVRQRVATGAGTERPVTEHLAYVWVFPDYGAGVILTTAFTDLAEAGRWRPAFDELAAAVELEPGGQARSR